MASHPDSEISIHPYFKVPKGAFEGLQPLLEDFVRRTQNEAGCLYYGFTLNVGDEYDSLYCREAYVNAEGVFAHLANVGALLPQLTAIAPLIKIEFHGPADQLDLIREAVAHLQPVFFVRQSGFTRRTH
jgi:quinol monooxygenase YgiN